LRQKTVLFLSNGAGAKNASVPFAFNPTRKEDFSENLFALALICAERLVVMRRVLLRRIDRFTNEIHLAAGE
jgi:hypothetical protein